MTEQELIIKIKDGSEPAFKTLVAQFGGRVFNTALGLMRHAQDAEDIAQEVFIKIYSGIHQFKGTSNLTTWIYRITVTTCLDHLRSRKRKKIWDTLFFFAGTAGREPTDFIHPGIQLENKETGKLLFKIIAQLPESQQTALVLHKLEGLSYKEIAAILNSTPAAVDSLLQRAKQTLKKKWNNK